MFLTPSIPLFFLKGQTQSYSSTKFLKALRIATSSNTNLSVSEQKAYHLDNLFWSTHFSLVVLNS